MGTDGMATGAPEQLMVCEYCDTVYRRCALARGEVAECPRCLCVLERHQWLNPAVLLALVLTALLLFVQANVWPIVTLGLNGQFNGVTLWGMIIALWREDAGVVAVITAATLFVFPLVKMLLLGWLLWFARLGARAPGFARMMVILHFVNPWTMSEVFVLGALVSIVKAHLYFEVVADPGIYAYAALTVLITLFSGMDLRDLWDMPELDAP